MLVLPAINAGIQTLSTEAAPRNGPWEQELKPGYEGAVRCTTVVMGNWRKKTVPFGPSPMTTDTQMA